MYRRFIAGYDSSAQARDAIALAARLAEATRVEVVVATARYRDAYPSRLAEREEPDLLVIGSAAHGPLGPDGLRSQDSG